VNDNFLTLCLIYMPGLGLGLTGLGLSGLDYITGESRAVIINYK